MFSGIACRRCGARWSRVGVLVSVGAVTALGGLAGAPLPAAGETGTPGGSSAASCPAANPPNALTLIAGTPQTAQIDAGFATGLQVALANSDGCPVTGAAGVPVAFSAPSSGASGLFSASASIAVTVGTDATGVASAPAFTADGTAGTYAVTASSPYGSVSFSLTNTAAGVPERVTAVGSTSRSATVTRGYAQPLQARVLDGAGNAVAGATVTFTLSSGAAADACGAGSAADASFAGGAASQVSATTGASGVATSPPFTANAVAGSFIATATVSSGAGAQAGAGAPAGVVGDGAAPGAIAASFALRNLAGDAVHDHGYAIPGAARGHRHGRREERRPARAGDVRGARRRPERALHDPRAQHRAWSLACLAPPHCEGRDRRLRDSCGAVPDRGRGGRLHRRGERRARAAGGVRARQ